MLIPIALIDALWLLAELGYAAFTHFTGLYVYDLKLFCSGAWADLEPSWGYAAS